MDPLIRKDVSQTPLPPPAPIQNPPDKEDCGCSEQVPGSSSTKEGCPSIVYTTGGFTLVGRNSTTGNCELIPLDFIQDNQVVQPPEFSYPQSSYTFTQGTVIPDIVPVSTGGVITSYSIDITLAASLSFDTSTGIISGTATLASSNVTYHITATGPGGTFIFAVQIVMTSV